LILNGTADAVPNHTSMHAADLPVLLQKAN